jgi:Na+/H+ antiporter
MVLFVSILILLIASVLLTLLARRLCIPYPALLALGGAAIALIPGVPYIELEPSLALALFVAPVLLDAAYDTSLRDLRDNRLPIITLVVVAVGVTTLAVAIVFRSFVPDVPWAAAIALGAIVAPPDAAAAIAVLRTLSIPSRLMQILEGESLFNDASALLIFAVAVRLVGDANATVGSLVPTYAVSIVGGLAAGLAFGWLTVRLFPRITHPSASIVMQFTLTYGLWVIAEHFHLSAILTIVAYGIAAARFGGDGLDPIIRIKSFAVWDTVVFLTNVLAFALIGLQVGALVTELDPAQRARYFMIGGVVLLTVILVRIAWVMAFNAGLRLKNHYIGVDLPDRMMRPSARSGLVVSWSGMRGIVTLAAALALPQDFPERDLIQFCAFTVVLGTLVIQGFTLGPLVRRLHFPYDGQIDQEIILARRAALEAAIGTLGGDDSVYAEALRTEYRAMLETIEGTPPEAPLELSPMDARRVRAVRAAREVISILRAEGQIGDLAFHQVEAALDRADVYAKRHSLPA